MKNNKVRMNISREMHEWFTAIDGKTNDDRMQELARAKSGYEQLLEAYGNRVVSAYSEIKTLKCLLGLSMTVSIISIGYLAYAQGWFA